MSAFLELLINAAWVRFTFPSKTTEEILSAKLILSFLHLLNGLLSSPLTARTLGLLIILTQQWGQINSQEMLRD